MKRLFVCLLLVGVVGCGEKEPVDKQPYGVSHQEASPGTATSRENPIHEVISSYLAQGEWRARLQYVSEPRKAKPLMEKFYDSAEPGNLDVVWWGSTQESSLVGGSTTVSVVVQRPDGSGRTEFTYIVARTSQGYRVDWLRTFDQELKSRGLISWGEISRNGMQELLAKHLETVPDRYRLDFVKMLDVTFQGFDDHYIDYLPSVQIDTNGLLSSYKQDERDKWFGIKIKDKEGEYFYATLALKNEWVDTFLEFDRGQRLNIMGQVVELKNNSKHALLLEGIDIFGIDSGGIAEDLPSAINPDCKNTVGMAFRRIESGTFQMGFTPEEVQRFGKADKIDHYVNDAQRHKVEITRPFYIGITEVTRSQYIAVMGDDPSVARGPSFLPVDSVTWNDAVEFCKKLSKKEGQIYRLPTEAEWEYACRAGSSGLWSFNYSELSESSAYGWIGSNSDKKPHPVAQKKENNWGLFDMHGNLWEWCSDYYSEDYYGVSPPSDPQGPEKGQYRVMRGGSFSDTIPRMFSASRSRNTESYRDRHNGFRVVLELKEKP